MLSSDAMNCWKMDGKPDDYEKWFRFNLQFDIDSRFYHSWFSYGVDKDQAKTRFRQGRGLMYIYESMESSQEEVDEIFPS